MTWTTQNNQLNKEFTFKGFKTAMTFVNQVADLANQADHHPDIFIYDYKKVRLTLTTHCEGNQITDKDHDLAKQIDDLIKDTTTK